MAEIAEQAEREGATLVVDESFMDFDDADTFVKEAIQKPHVVCLRAFTGLFGLAGLRAGYAVANDEIIGGLRAAQEPWTVSAPAEQAAIAALRDWWFVKRTRKLIAEERDRLLSELRLLPGVEPFPASANFVFVKLASMDSVTLTEKLALRGLLIRDCSSFPGLGRRFVRIAVRTRRENKQLIKALREILIP
jgi:threonine-phosphate decarboxylase